MSVLFPGAAEALQVRLFSAGTVELGEWWPRTDQIRGFWRLYFNDREGVSLLLRTGRFDMPRERVVLVPSGLDFQANLERDVRQLYCHFDFVGWPPETTTQLLPDPLVLEPDAERDALTLRLREELAEADEIDPILGSRLKALVHLSFADALSVLPDESTGRFLRLVDGHRELFGVLQYIEENLGHTLSNAHLAELAGSSESRFIRRFRAAMGQSPARYVQDRRLRRAAELLVSSDEGIGEIAEACGFANRYYFSRVFA
ncbi:MAG: AraC family transcriptional regulator, partial [Myxococcota bacterium]|nr:AraC family transcriptional regulator [Myxococcota bacterium]